MSPTKIFRCRILKQFVNLITLLCDGKCHCNAAKTILWQLIVTYLLKSEDLFDTYIAAMKRKTLQILTTTIFTKTNRQ